MGRIEAQVLIMVVSIALVSVPAGAINFCSDTCTQSTSCDLACFDVVEGNVFFSTCGDYGVCQPPTCHDPKSVTTRVDTILTGSTIIFSACYQDNFFPFAPPQLYDYTTFFYRHDTVKVTEYCNGTITEEITASSTSTGSCYRRTGNCFFATSPPPFPVCTN